MMSTGTNYEQRDIVLIPFPYSDLSSEKKRPVIILSNRWYNNRNSDVICCAITTNPNRIMDGIEITPVDLESGRLDKLCFIKPGTVFTLYKKKILKRLATLNVKASKEVVKNLNLKITIDE